MSHRLDQNRQLASWVNAGHNEIVDRRLPSVQSSHKLAVDVDQREIVDDDPQLVSVLGNRSLVDNEALVEHFELVCFEQIGRRGVYKGWCRQVGEESSDS